MDNIEKKKKKIEDTAKRLVESDVHANITGIVSRMAENPWFQEKLLEAADGFFFGGFKVDPETEEEEYIQVYEHWIVRPWLGLKLAEHGEIVEHDFCGLVVWGRQCTGQAIFMDGVIRRIARELAEQGVQ